MSLIEINNAKRNEYAILRDYHISVGDRYMADYYDTLIAELGKGEEQMDSKKSISIAVLHTVARLH